MEFGRLPVIKDASQLVRSVDQKAGLAISSADEDATSKLELVQFVDFGDDWNAFFEQKDQFDESYAVMAYKLVHLPLFRSDFLLFWLQVTQVRIFDPLKRL